VGYGWSPGLGFMQCDTISKKVDRLIDDLGRRELELGSRIVWVRVLPSDPDSGQGNARLTCNGIPKGRLSVEGPYLSKLGGRQTEWNHSSEYVCRPWRCCIAERILNTKVCAIYPSNTASTPHSPLATQICMIQTRTP